MLDNELNKKIGRELENSDRPKNKTNIITLGIILLILTSIFFLEPAITGFITAEKQFEYFENIDTEFNQNSEYTWTPKNTGLLRSLKLTGTYKTEGQIKVYLEDEDIRYLIFDSTNTDKNGIGSITGLVTLNDTNNNQLDNNSNDNNNLIINESNQTINTTPILDDSVEKTINIKLNYGTNEIYDINNDGIEDINSVIDITVEDTSFNWQVEENNLCTKWEIYNVEEEKSTTICNGNENCCAFVALLPSKKQWNEPLFMTYGLHDSSLNNKISSQVIHVDFNLSSEQPYSEIYYSNWEELPVKFYTSSANFENTCIETCSLSLNKDSYKLIIELDNSALTIDKIDYIIEKKAENNPPFSQKYFKFNINTRNFSH